MHYIINFLDPTIPDLLITHFCNITKMHRIIIYGSNGALGQHLVQHFKNLPTKYEIISIAHQGNSECNISIVADKTAASIDFQGQAILNQLSERLSVDNSKVDAILNVAGGWVGGTPKGKNFLSNFDVAIRQSVYPSAISAKIANLYLKESGLLVLSGSAASVQGNTGAIVYSAAKAAVHNLTKSLAFETKSGMPENSSTICILPGIIDTENNRRWMAEADQSNWNKLEDIGKLMQNWVENVSSRPENGSLVELVSDEKGMTTKIV